MVIPHCLKHNAQSFSHAEQVCLLKAHVLVVGCGGLGGTCLELLARSGVGNLSVIDGDILEESNLNRQILATTQSLGQHKTTAAVNRVQSIAPHVQITGYPVFAVESMLEDMFNQCLPPCQVMIDALDVISGKCMLARVCQKQGIPLIHGAVSGFYGHVSTLFPGDNTLEWLYPESARQSANPREPERYKSGTAVAVNTIASRQVMETLHILLGETSSLERGKTTFFDISANVHVDGWC